MKKSTVTSNHSEWAKLVAYLPNEATYDQSTQEAVQILAAFVKKCSDVTLLAPLLPVEINSSTASGRAVVIDFLAPAPIQRTIAAKFVLLAEEYPKAKMLLTQESGILSTLVS